LRGTSPSKIASTPGFNRKKKSDPLEQKLWNVREHDLDEPLPSVLQATTAVQHYRQRDRAPYGFRDRRKTRVNESTLLDLSRYLVVEILCMPVCFRHKHSGLKYYLQCEWFLGVLHFHRVEVITF
jgi:hypothetical protein